MKKNLMDNIRGSVNAPKSAPDNSSQPASEQPKDTAENAPKAKSPTRRTTLDLDVELLTRLKILSFVSRRSMRDVIEAGIRDQISAFEEAHGTLSAAAFTGQGDFGTV